MSEKNKVKYSVNNINNLSNIKVKMEKNKMKTITDHVDTKNELEDQFILRLPNAEAQYLRNILRKKPKKIEKVLSLEMYENERRGNVRIKKKSLPGTLVTLPTIVEAHKTYNKINIYKTASISQMLICGEKTEGLESVLKKEGGRKNVYPHGLTPPMKNVLHQRFRKTMKNHEDMKEAVDVQKEVSLLLRMDFDAVATRFEITTANNTTKTESVTEDMLFGVMSPSDSEDSSTTSVYDIMEFNN